MGIQESKAIRRPSQLRTKSGFMFGGLERTRDQLPPVISSADSRGDVVDLSPSIINWLHETHQDVLTLLVFSLHIYEIKTMQRSWSYEKQVGKKSKFLKPRVFNENRNQLTVNPNRRNLIWE